ncbi:MAG: AIR synthase family protein [Clostridiales bacterium]|jgi:hydrogenase maturation factor|nr:AIR synthase family protein [Clostridiales bacterium]
MKQILGIGKLPNDILEKLVLDKLPPRRGDVLLHAAIGEDCTAVDFKKYACVLSSDPITGAVKNIGRLSVHISCNDLAACGCEPVGVLFTLLAPVGATGDEISNIMEDAAIACNSMNVEILGGHTEVTDAVNRFVISTTAVGRIIKDKLISTNGSKCGDCVLITKYPAIEGTAVVASDFETELVPVIGQLIVDEAKTLIDKISVVNEGLIGASIGVSSMHDITEGGVLGAAWEMAKTSGHGIRIDLTKLELLHSTDLICNYFKLDPYRLISSGSMMMTVSEALVSELQAELSENGINSFKIGQMTAEKVFSFYNGSIWQPIDPPGADELFKLLHK